MHQIYEPSDDSYLLSNTLKKYFSAHNKNLKFLEIGCGSGIQVKTLLSLGIKKQNIFCSDINFLAVEECKKLGVKCVVSNLFQNIKEVQAAIPLHVLIQHT